jgi:uncharacterized protein YndB with AHSA1/START domain
VSAYLGQRRNTRVATRPLVVAAVDLPTPAETTFAAFTDPTVYSRWLQVPVIIDGDRFAATLEWGTEVRGRYELVVPPQLIVMSWDFEDDNVPVPGQPLTGYLRVYSDGDGSRVEVHQLVDTPEQAAFMEGAWAMVLGRLKTNVLAATTGPAPARRPRRRKESARASKP